MSAFELALPEMHRLRRTRLKIRRRDGIEGQQIDMCQKSRAKTGQRGKVFLAVVNAVYKQVFQGNAPIGFPDVVLQLLFEFGKRLIFHMGHQDIANGLASRMERNCQSELFRLLRKELDARQNATCGNGDASRPYLQEFRMVDDAQCRQHGIVVQKRLSLPHGNDIADPLPHVLLGRQNLIHHLADGEVACKPFVPCGAEGTAHGATHLRGEAHGQPFAVLLCRRGWHGNGFHSMAVFA